MFWSLCPVEAKIIKLIDDLYHTYYMIYIMAHQQHPYHTVVAEQYEVTGYIRGHMVKTNGVVREKNPMWTVNEDGQPRVLMYCEPDILCKFCPESYQKILDFEQKHRNGKKFSWSKKDKHHVNTKYIRANFNDTAIYIHQVIMDWYGHGSGTTGLSVDHIDRNPLNNTLANLRLATLEEQHQNSKGIAPNTKKDRRQDAKTLPEGILQDDIPKYITYNLNTYGPNRDFSREFFRIEGHPLLSIAGSTWSSTSKQSVSLRDKLQQAKTALEYLNVHGTLPEKVERELPQYVTYYKDREHHLLVWQKNVGDDRLSKKITIEREYDELSKDDQDRELYRLNVEVVKKYGVLYAIFELDPAVLQQIQLEKEQELPTYVRIQEFYDGNYLVFNKNKGDGRISSTQKLPANYNINKELYLLNERIVEKYGQEHAIILDKFAYDAAVDDVIDLPEDVYVSLKCNTPYIFVKRGNETFSMILPERYCMKEQIARILLPEYQTKDHERTMDDHKLILPNVKPTNISICIKDKRYHQMQYAVKTKEYRHSKAMTLPKTDTFNLNLEFVKMNEHIIHNYGKEFAILLCK